MASDTDNAARRVMEVIPLVMRTLALEMRSTGLLLAPVHCGLLVALAEGPHNLTELAERHAVSLPTMSSSISTLEERGWVRRARDAADRRVVFVELTPVGRVVLEKLTRSVTGQVGELLAPLSAAEREQLLVGLSILRACFTRSTSRE
jgi:DNA-binding MarR family transcriptional regulator